MAEEQVVVVGAGIVGLAVARQLARQRPGASVTVVEKEPLVARHQSGHNSGVVHAGLYYEPGSLKARLCRRGAVLLFDYCRERGIGYVERGKLVVALDEDERARLGALHERALANGVPGLRLLDAAALREVEPHATGVAALHSPSTAVVDFPPVCRAFAADLAALGGQVVCGFAVTGIERRGSRILVRAPERAVEADRVIICAGL
ncbi:MAG TPA: FAD-dependent oxidoreductase, partial [Frankiaceae bacterium]|nr:FAD-dependent oxidoreductase [Frankiaceae bacterium]